MKTITASRDLTVTSPELADAVLIFQNAHTSALSLFQAFELARANGGKPRGMTTDQEQDILRAMLVMACAGLDASIKQVIRDALALVVQVSADAQALLEKFLERQIRGEDAEFGVNPKYLARVLATSDPYRKVVETYVSALTGDSLQSADQLFKVVAALGLEPRAINLEKATLKPIFDARNQIIHELDIDLEGERRKRILRGMGDMIAWTDRVLLLSRTIIESIDRTIPPPDQRVHRTRLTRR